MARRGVVRWAHYWIRHWSLLLNKNISEYWVLVNLLILFLCFFPSITVSTRGKSVIQDYRFLPEHDLPPLVLYDNNYPPPEEEEGCNDEVVNIDTLYLQLPELPSRLRTRLMDSYGQPTVRSYWLNDKHYSLDFLLMRVLVRTELWAVSNANGR